MKKNIAIVGGGFSGLGACYHILTRNKNCNVTLFDKDAPGKGASQIAGGTLHKFSGRDMKYCWMADRAIECAMHLLELTKSYYKNGIIRCALNTEQEQLFKKLSIEQPQNFEMIENNVDLEKYITTKKNLLMKNVITVDVKQYLEKLWSICEDMGVNFIKSRVVIKDLNAFGYMSCCRRWNKILYIVKI